MYLYETHCDCFSEDVHPKKIYLNTVARIIMFNVIKWYVGFTPDDLGLVSDFRTRVNHRWEQQHIQSMALILYSDDSIL